MKTDSNVRICDSLARGEFLEVFPMKARLFTRTIFVVILSQLMAGVLYSAERASVGQLAAVSLKAKGLLWPARISLKAALQFAFP